MDDAQINELFMKMADSIDGSVNEDVRAIFSLLVRSTLQYRDQLQGDLAITLTVEDVRACLDWLMEIMRTKRQPQTDNAVRVELLQRWLTELTP